MASRIPSSSDMEIPVNLASDLPILWRMLRGQPEAADHQGRLDGFYRPQAERYDAFREKLLHGRRELFTILDLPEGGVLVELGGGTGRNLEFLGERLGRLWRVYLVDLCPALLERAEQRCRERGWSNVVPVLADACSWRPPMPVDAVACSYSLSMIPDWFAAVDNAAAMLRPGGVFGAVDFYVARRHPPAGLTRHSFFTRTFWPAWFGHDGVHPDADHLPYLLKRFARERLDEQRGSVPWLPAVRVPWYLFLGRQTAPGISS